MAKTSPPRALFFINALASLDNFSAHRIEWRGQMWPTVEHAYQAAHFEDGELRDAIRNAPSPFMAKAMASRWEAWENPEWATVKVAVMAELLRCKVEQHPDVAAILAGTGNAVLVEANDADPFWGHGAAPAHRGENMMGELWEDIRLDLAADARNG